MEVLFGILFAKLLSVSTIVLGILVGIFARAWWHVALGSIAIAAVGEIFLSAVQETRTFNPMIFVIGVFAAALWIVAAFLVKRQWAASQSN